MPFTPYHDKDCAYTTPNQTPYPLTTDKTGGWVAPNVPVNPPCCEMPQQRNFDLENLVWGMQTIVTPLLTLIQSSLTEVKTSIIAVGNDLNAFALQNTTDLNAIKTDLDLIKTDLDLIATNVKSITLNIAAIPVSVFYYFSPTGDAALLSTLIAGVAIGAGKIGVLSSGPGGGLYSGAETTYYAVLCDNSYRVQHPITRNGIFIKTTAQYNAAYLYCGQATINLTIYNISDLIL